MSLNKITYTDKVALNPQPSVANENKVSDADMNEIKSVVNAGIDSIEAITNYEIGEKQIGVYNDEGNEVPLYRAIINFGATSTNPYKPSIAGLNIGKLLSVSGAIKTGATDIIPIAIWYNNTYFMQTTVKLNTETVDIAWGGWGSLQGGYIVLEYTKAS